MYVCTYICTCVHMYPSPQNGEILKDDIVLSVFDDDLPELAEYLTLRLVNAYGEAVLSDTAVSGGGGGGHLIERGGSLCEEAGGKCK